jgi:hypothetical protein
MGFFTRLSTGWQISKTCMRVLKENSQLIIFPILSGLSLLILIGSFFTGLFFSAEGEIENIIGDNDLMIYGVVFLVYLVNYFVVVFFNMALMHCVKLYFDGEEPTVKKGLQFSLGRIGAILSWAIFAATVGMILKIIQENLGIVGKIITGILGFAWNVGSFFVVPVLAYENVGPLEALKRSIGQMKAKWGESIGATFSFGLLQLCAILLIAIPALLLGAVTHFAVTVAIMMVSLVVIMVVSSALNSIFVYAAYSNVNGNIDNHFNSQMFDSIFIEKK